MRALFLALAILFAPLSAAAQPGGKVPLIGVLDSRILFDDPAPALGLRRLYLEPLRELGYVEGKNLALTHRYAYGRLDKLPDLAAQLVNAKVDVILAWGTPAALAAKNATRTIPIVMVGVADPVAVGLVASLARPGGNVTGLSLNSVELSGKRVQLVKELVPRATRIAVLTNPDDPASAPALRAMEAAARSVGLQLQPVEVRAPKDLENAFAVVKRDLAGGLIVLPGDIFFESRRRIAELAEKQRLATVAEPRAFVEAGGLLAFGPSEANLYRQAAGFVDKILRGAKPSDLPVEQPTKFDLVINMKTAKALGLTIPQSVLIQAEQVFQ